MHRTNLIALLVAAVTLALLAPVSALGADKANFPDEWFFKNNAPQLKAHWGKRAPVLTAGNWYNGKRSISQMRGKIVVLDFWGVWCGPCVRAVPKNIEFVEKYRDKGVEFVAIHSTNQGERMKSFAQQRGINYPVGVDNGNTTARAYGVQFWPTYILIDREGVIRAYGLLPDRIDDAVDALLAEQPGSGSSGAETVDFAKGIVPSEWLEGSMTQRRRLAAIEGRTAPALELAETMNHEGPIDLESMRGKVVLVDFWATWCGPCMRSIPKLNKLAAKYEDDGLVIVGVCALKGQEKMRATAERRGIEFPIAQDLRGQTAKKYMVNGYPDFALVGRDGTVLVADLANDKIEEAIVAALAYDPTPSANSMDADTGE